MGGFGGGVPPNGGFGGSRAGKAGSGGDRPAPFDDDSDIDDEDVDTGMNHVPGMLGGNGMISPGLAGGLGGLGPVGGFGAPMGMDPNRVARIQQSYLAGRAAAFNNMMGGSMGGISGFGGRGRSRGRRRW